MGRRETFSVKIKREIKLEFQKTVKEKGLSTCFIIESLMIAWIEGIKAPARAKVDQSSTISITQNFTRVFTRGRRFLKDAKKDFRKDVDVLGEVHETNFYNPDSNMWEFKDDTLNDVGHVIGCGCSKCRPKSLQ